MQSTPNATAENGNTDQISADALLVSSSSISSIPQPTPTASLRRSNKQVVIFFSVVVELLLLVSRAINCTTEEQRFIIVEVDSIPVGLPRLHTLPEERSKETNYVHLCLCDEKKDGKKVEKKDEKKDVCSLPSTTCQRCHVWTLPQIFRGNFELIFDELDDT
nr:hypothetical protein Iba_chr15bCG8870 [Ipomoea batatas]